MWPRMHGAMHVAHRRNMQNYVVASFNIAASSNQHPGPLQVVAYDGGAFAGMQFQPKARTVQVSVSEAIPAQGTNSAGERE